LIVEAPELERRWRLAETRPTTSPDDVSADPLSVAWPESSVFVGADGSGTRHLLIPIADNTAVTEEASGAVVTVRKRTLVLEGARHAYLDLACKRADLFDQFAVLASEVVNTAARTPEHAVRIAGEVLTSWRELLRLMNPSALTRDAVIGLYGELSILGRIVALDPLHGLDAWTGPTGARHDFQRGPNNLEVKSSTARRGRPMVIHGLDQLEKIPNTTLHLWWVRLEVSVGRGQSLRSLVDEILNSCLRHADLEQKLIKVGYDLAQPQLYDRPLFTQIESRLYLVDDEFPTLTHKHLVAGDLPHGVIALSYEINVSGDKPSALPAADEDSLLLHLAHHS
jgi:Putative  PD-(D/E)XK family member, (DUF4420)